MKRLTGVLTAALMLAVIAAGCSGNDDVKTEEVGQPLEKQIVGVWRSGDYWVSFSEDGYNSAYILIDGNGRIDEGNYEMDGNTIVVENSKFLNTTKYLITGINESSLNVTLYYHYPHEHGSPDVIENLTFKKTQEIPCEKEDGLDGKVFTCSLPSMRYANGDSVIFTNTFHNQFHSISIRSISDKNYPDIYYDGYYVYCPPTLYYVMMYDIYRREQQTQIGELSFDNKGNVIYEHIKGNGD